MNAKDKGYLEALFLDRSESAKLLEKPSMRGIKNSVVEKYSDQAHFIYELLQNADDAYATSASFILEDSRLTFIHNGTRHFSVSDPSREEKDAIEGKLGDINAITSIANSNKSDASIGKFGVGFKAVFQYTSTPHIYDRDFSFKIERFIVPVQLDQDAQCRNQNETVFVFPFDNPERSPEESYDDILLKLKNLTYPLLFLTDLNSIQYKANNFFGSYSKHIEKKYLFNNLEAEYICLTHKVATEEQKEYLWLFSELDDLNHRYSVGYFVDDNGKLRPVEYPAFCFFPTKVITGLNFIIHAPFLLTESREGIRAGVSHNERMIELLANLAAKALFSFKEIGYREGVRIIDDGIINIIPYELPWKLNLSVEKRDISFYPFYLSMLKLFKTEEILPIWNGYTTSVNAYWASVPQLADLFSDEQLSDLCGNNSAHWVFASLGRDEILHTNKSLANYLDNVVRSSLSEDVIINGRMREMHFNRAKGQEQTIESIPGLSSGFIEKQSVEWLEKFYKWISETKHRRDLVKQKPIFINQEGLAVPAFDKDDQPVLFLPVENIHSYSTIHHSLLSNPEILKFIHEMGIKQPSLRDQIYNIVLPMYEDKKVENPDLHFRLFFDYYCNHCLNGEDEKFISSVRECGFLSCFGNNDQKDGWGIARDMYLPNQELLIYFENDPDIVFVDLDKYRQIVGPYKEKQLLSFLGDIGVKNSIEIVKVKIDPAKSGRKDIPIPRSSRTPIWEEKSIIGCDRIINEIVNKHESAKSYLLWSILLSLIKKYCTRRFTLSDALKGECHFYFHTPQMLEFPSFDETLLRESAWLRNREGQYVSAEQVVREQLDVGYEFDAEESEDLIHFLGIRKESDIIGIDEAESVLSEEQRAKIQFADKMKRLGILESDIVELTKIKKRREKRMLRLLDQGAEESMDNNDNIGKNGRNIEIDSESALKHTSLDRIATEVVHDIIGRINEPQILEDSENVPAEDADQDEYRLSVLDYSARIQQAKEKSAAEINRIASYEQLQQTILNLPKYSFGWFNALLEMESMNYGEGNTDEREVSISFSRIEREAGTKRTLVLKHPSRFIPHFIEDLSDLPLAIYTFGGKKRIVAIEVASIKSYTLLVKLKNEMDMESIDFDTVISAVIDVKSPSFLLEELSKRFAELELDAAYNMKENLPENIEFIFGPPGTGKTTYLAKNILMPLMNSHDRCRVLVLTPTNKAADVLVRRVMDVSGEDLSYQNWLVRFGSTGDEHVEQSPVFHDRSIDVRKAVRCVMVTTIARFAYDYIAYDNARLFLDDFQWDYIVIDEASMIPIANIVYPLYKQTPEKFIVSGDPFQIEPVTSVSLWKDENIFKMVNLKSFVNPQTEPYQYKIELLETQYRSVPEIGRLYSELSYGGVLKHYRLSESRKALQLSDDMGIETLNIIKFPVSKYESIYRTKRLQRSSVYQIYSALFTFEYVRYLTRRIAENNPGITIRVGVIAPYRAQADLIEKLMVSEQLPDTVDIHVGTIHGFQGDECDIIFAVFNPPPYISSSSEMFLNKQNIINVSVSRAKDYLFVIMPDDMTENISNLRIVKLVEELIKKGNSWSEIDSFSLEEQMFADQRYLENNVFSTGHQSVNVYGLPEKYYEVRTEENAVDIQIHQKWYDDKQNSEKIEKNEHNVAIISEQKTGKLIQNIDIPSVDVCFAREKDFISDQEDLIRISRTLIAAGKYRDNMLFVVGTVCGFKVNELAQICFEDFLNKDGSFKISVIISEDEERKVEMKRIVWRITLNQVLKNAIALYLEHNPVERLSGYMFKSESGNGRDDDRPLSRAAINLIARSTGDLIGSDVPVSPRTFRKTFVYHHMMLANDIQELVTIAEMLKKRTVSDLLKYIGISEQEFRQEKERYSSHRNDFFAESKIEKGCI